MTVITRNEAANVAAALQSVAWADEIIVVDAESTDETVAVAERIGATRVVVRPWAGYVEQKNYAASLAAHDWIFSLDADERVPPALAASVRQALATEPAAAAFRMRRVTWHLGRWIRTTDWYPDYQTRVYDRRRAQWTGRYVHEGLAVNGPVGDLTGELEHRPYRDISEHLDTIDLYSTAAAAQMREAGRSAGLVQMLLHPPLAFLRNYIARRGFRDGLPGAIVSVMNSYYVFLKFAKLWALRNPEP